MAPTAGQVLDALSGRYGPMVVRWRWQRRTRDNLFIDDISAALIADSAPTLRMSSFAPTTMTLGGIELLVNRLPVDFDATTDVIAVIEERYIAGEWVSFPLGLFKLDVADFVYSADGDPTILCEAADLSVDLLDSGPATSYTVASGTSYATAVGAVFTALGLEYDMSNLPASTTPVNVTWPPYPETTWLNIVSDLCFGLNFHTPWPNASGVFVTKEQINPYTETVSVTYVDDEEPRMISAAQPYIRREDKSSKANVCVVLIDDPFHANFGYYMKRNEDAASEISVPNVGERVEEINYDHDPSTSCILDNTTALAIADFRLRWVDSQVHVATLPTFADPRRGPHEFYSVEVEDDSHGGVPSVWMVLEWERGLSAEAGPMVHTVGHVHNRTISDE